MHPFLESLYVKRKKATATITDEIDDKDNEMKLNVFFLIKFTIISSNTRKQNTRKLLNYMPNIHDKKYKESKIVEKCLGWINLLVVSRDKCNNGIKREILLEVCQ